MLSKYCSDFGHKSSVIRFYVIFFEKLLLNLSFSSSMFQITGGTSGAWLHGEDKTLKLTSEGDSSKVSSSSRKRNPVFADLFGSVCYTFQHGKFRKKYGDLTRVDARLEINSAFAFAKNITSMFQHTPAPHDNSASLPRLGLVFQQQV